MWRRKHCSEEKQRGAAEMPSDFARFNRFTPLCFQFLAFGLPRVDHRVHTHMNTSVSVRTRARWKDRCDRSNYLERSSPLIFLSSEDYSLHRIPWQWTRGHVTTKIYTPSMIARRENDEQRLWYTVSWKRDKECQRYFKIELNMLA